MQAELPCSSVVLWVPMSTPNGTSCNIIGLFMLIVSATCHSCWQNGSPTIILSRDTDFCAEKGVSRHEKQPYDRKLSAIHGFIPKRVCRCMETWLSCPNRHTPVRDTDYLAKKECVAARKAALCTEISPRHRVSPGVSQDYKRERVRRNPPPKRGEARLHTGMATGDSGMSGCYFIRRRPMRARSRSMETTGTLTC